MLIGVLSLVVSTFALAGAYYTWKQVDLLRKDSQEKKVWATKHSEAFSLVLKTNKGIIVKPSVNTNGYPRVFADHAFHHSDGLVEEHDDSKGARCRPIRAADCSGSDSENH